MTVGDCESRVEEVAEGMFCLLRRTVYIENVEPGLSEFLRQYNGKMWGMSEQRVCCSTL